jgi:hypothetical protein
MRGETCIFGSTTGRIRRAGMAKSNKKLTRRDFLKKSTIAAGGPPSPPERLGHPP